MAFTAAMFNTVREVEGAMLALRQADIEQITLIARNTCKREVLADDLIARNPLAELTTLPETTEITDRLPHWFVEMLPAAGQSGKWYQDWLNDDYVLLIAVIEEPPVERALGILRRHGGALYGQEKG